MCVCNSDKIGPMCVMYNKRIAGAVYGVEWKVILITSELSVV